MPFDGREFEQSNLMLEKLDSVIDLLSSEDKWCKYQVRTNDGRRCIMGVLIDVDGAALLADPILAAARELTGKSHGRVERFNDHRKTDHRLVLAVLRRARENLLLGKMTSGRTPTVARRVRTFYAALARLSS